MPRTAASEADQQVLLTFQLLASDNPLLVAELLKSRKGKLRHARLTTLATIGLMTERQVIAGEPLASQQVQRRGSNEHGNGADESPDLTSGDVAEVVEVD
jgi:hypothetical protein